MSATGVYHVKIETAEETLLVGVCAAGKTEARTTVVARVRGDGYTDPMPVSCERVAGAHGWEYGATLIYGAVA